MGEVELKPQMHPASPWALINLALLPRRLRDDSMYVYVRVEGPAEHWPWGGLGALKGLRGQDVLEAAEGSCSRGREIM